MRFYGKGIVWHDGKTLCKFIGGVLDTDDETIAQVLIERGYGCQIDATINNPSTSDRPISQSTTITSEPTRKDLLSVAKDRGIKGADRMSKDTLIIALKEVE